MTSLCNDRGGNLLVTIGDIMAAEWARLFYNSPSWKKTREAYKSYRRGLCERCLENGIVRAGVEVHHIKPLTQKNINDPTITLAWDNLMLLCTQCHDEVHHRKRDVRTHKRFIVRQDGSVVVKQ